MTVSIRKFLLINLLLALAIVTTLTAVGNYYLDQKDIQRHLDILMVMSSLSYQAMLGEDLNPQRLSDIQAALNNVPSTIELYHHNHSSNLPTKPFTKRFNLQIWTDQEKLLLHSPSAKQLSFDHSIDGFSDQTIANSNWRVFVLHNPQLKIKTLIAEQYSTRNELGHRLAQDDLYIMLLTFPLSGLLIWIIIGRGFDSLSRVTRELSNRAPSYLEPVSLKEIPLEIKPLIDELNKLFIRLQQAFEREKRFAADAAHELRTPLAALKTQAQVALKTDNVSERNVALQNVVTGVDRSTHIIQQLLTMSRLVPEATIIEESDYVNLSKLAAEITAHLIPFALDKKIEVELNAEKDNLTIRGNVTALSILIRNLVDNAIRYTSKGGMVKVSVEEQDHMVVLRVTDNGPGIPAELRARVFERFFRVLGSKSPGSGLGLAIVQQIARLHQGNVQLNAPAGDNTGLEVEVSFPKINKALPATESL